MNPLEDRLRDLLKRKEPPANFEARVLARIANVVQPKPGYWQKLTFYFQRPRLQWSIACAVLCLLLVAGGVQYRRHQRERVEGEMAKAQVMLALHIASNKLNHAQKVVLERVQH